jgi:hypothetical protein
LLIESQRLRRRRAPDNWHWRAARFLSPALYRRNNASLGTTATLAANMASTRASARRMSSTLRAVPVEDVMDRRLQALFDLAIVLALCAAVVFVVDVFGQASANRPISAAWNQWLFQLRDAKAIAYTFLGAVVMMIWLKGRSLF